MRDALLLVDVISDFAHEDGERLLASFRGAHGALVAALADAREAGLPVLYANDNHGVWDGDGPGQVRRAIEQGNGGELVAAIAPRPGDALILKPRYSAFDHTPLDIVLGELGTERLLLAGAATEMCVVQTAIDARELGLKVTILSDACASVDPRNERLALEYAERVVGARVARGAAVRADA